MLSYSFFLLLSTATKDLEQALRRSLITLLPIERHNLRGQRKKYLRDISKEQFNKKSIKPLLEGTCKTVGEHFLPGWRNIEGYGETVSNSSRTDNNLLKYFTRQTGHQLSLATSAGHFGIIGKTGR
ncbi:hypothetical protein SK355_03190 [Candidatus Fukatsuia symbiotica]|uniref:Uncharacterized protein n=1 Tax=Candidatus Fukatsuia symbiotica TaxID=1878942 RepID=A0A2U8I2V7_9GAMM|nr:hypothetical protein [Candidatus Fukatsuia symbiotica]AWK13440.1 hypothetical protein CCS41_01280 [Candidatus Fukatsuia symbiotica]MEA9444332.1 hypothetical protein [Candidatus Fukatsuia symbiotica]